MRKLNNSMVAIFCFLSISPSFAQKPINQVQQNDMVFLLEEEKMARDIYTTLFEFWDHQVFKNILEAEQRHLNRVETMVKQNDLLIPETVELNIVGKYQNSDLQELYNELITQGKVSLVEALKVGAWIEERNITDLNGAMANTEDEDMLWVYAQLEQASTNHLRAFNKNLTNHGISYEPQILSADVYAGIINADVNGKCGSSIKEKKTCCKGNKGCENRNKGKKAACKAQS